ncbi:MAG: bile acid:sodium symporter family protein, partial [Thermocrispum sp.]
VSLVLCVLSMVIGYWVPKLAGVGWRQSVASTMEVGVHNATLAIVIALNLMDSAAIGVAPGIYGVLMFLPAAVAAYAFANAKRSRAVPVSGR